ncbi:MAG: DUF427 domain-containing protein [Pseudomonadota bacterium]
MMWNYTGNKRPDFAEAPGPGQESVWDYPRPPALVPDSRQVRVLQGEDVIADTRGAVRILETASPPTFYLPPDDINVSLLRGAPGRSFCEWKGAATYYCLASDAAQLPIGWAYPQPQAPFTALAGWYSFYPGRIHCEVDGERVRPQPGGFYGGWITDEIVGPVKGESGTGHW